MHHFEVVIDVLVVKKKNTFFRLLPKIQFIDESFFTLEPVHDSVLYDFAKAYAWKKI